MPARNADQEKEILQWIEAVMGEPLPSGDFAEVSHNCNRSCHSTLHIYSVVQKEVREVDLMSTMARAPWDQPLRRRTSFDFFITSVHVVLRSSKARPGKV